MQNKLPQRRWQIQIAMRGIWCFNMLYDYPHLLNWSKHCSKIHKIVLFLCSFLHRLFYTEKFKTIMADIKTQQFSSLKNVRSPYNNVTRHLKTSVWHDLRPRPSDNNNITSKVPTVGLLSNGSLKCNKFNVMFTSYVTKSPSIEATKQVT